MQLAPSVRKNSPTGEIIGGATWATRHRICDEFLLQDGKYRNENVLKFYL